ncbi:type III PLP-dependent enzyme [Tardiphaga alba]|uniref:Type III PLP-dependent enzyme n=2 Tax=Tardiphaga alba TaxID=340268 RepID=A0ABX8AFK0_9BRAD|nr:type III PLP-dependent enzyme [Tardiphaga alba]QUS42294.1 type III PLP-dependent enzyme [Tardiphaga alba]
MTPTLTETLVQRHFSVSGADLCVGGLPVRELAAHHGTPLFIYDGGVMRANYRALKQALQGFAHIHYSVKANPAPAIIRLFASEGAGVEIASIGEYRAARAAGVAPDRILFAGPGKRVAELEAVIADGIDEVHVESYEEIARVAAIGARVGLRVRMSIRVNPVAAAQGGAMRMGGKPAPFGFDEEDLSNVVAAVMAQDALDLRGVHLFAGTQILDVDVLLSQWRHAIDVASRVAALAGKPLHTIDLGGGLGIPYFQGEGTLDLAGITKAVPDLQRLLRADPLLADARPIVEPGRFLAGPGGVYVMAVNASKLSRGTRFLVTDGGMHHHLAASGNLGQIIKRDYPIVAPARMDARDTSPATVVGPLCTPLDTLARKTDLPDLAADDLIAVLQSGAYGRTASPSGFLSQPEAGEILVESGVVEVMSAA